MKSQPHLLITFLALAFVCSTTKAGEPPDEPTFKRNKDGTRGHNDATGMATGAAASTTIPTTAPATAGGSDYGTVAGVDALGVVSIIPWGKKSADSKRVPTDAGADVLINLNPAKATDLKEGMWAKVLERDREGKAKKIIAGQFLQEDGDKVVVFKGLPEEFLVYHSDGWYTNTAGGVRFKVQPMGAGKTPSNPGSNLRAAEYKEPAGGFVVYFPKTLEGAVLGWGGFKPGANIPDDDGKVLVNKDTCTDYYWKHLNPTFALSPIKKYFPDGIPRSGFASAVSPG